MIFDQASGDPAAVVGKGRALLNLGRFSEAHDRFLAAQGGFDVDTPEFRRIEDYVKYSRGLEAYDKADPQVAYQYWATIEDAQLRFALDQAVREESSR